MQNFRPVILLLLLFITNISECREFKFYQFPELESITQELNNWCTKEDGSDLLISFLEFGHPWSPNALRIELKERKFKDDDLWAPPIFKEGTLKAVYYHWIEEKNIYEKEEVEYSLDDNEILRIENIVYKSELFGLPEDEPEQSMNGSTGFFLRDTDYSLDPIYVIARLVSGTTKKEVHRNISASIPMQYAYGEICKLLKERKAQPVAGGDATR